MNSIYTQLLESPTNILDLSYNDSYNLSIEELETFQIKAMNRRFQDLRHKIPVLSNMADIQKVDSINTINDIVPLLFPHTTYKSYPFSALESGDFKRLTKWLQGLTSTKISEFEHSGIETIDQWIEAMDANTDLRVVHTFGTTGKLSFLPRTLKETQYGARLVCNCIKDWFGNTGPDLLKQPLPVIQPSYQFGANAGLRGVSTLVQLFNDKGSAEYMYPNMRFSADVASLAGRLKAAKSKGGAKNVRISPSLKIRYQEFKTLEKQRASQLDSFFKRVQQKYGGRDIVIIAVWPTIFEWAEEGLRRGMSKVFGKNSVLVTGGGTKGKIFPDDWKEKIRDFLGFDTYLESYAMTEVIPTFPRCEAGYYHLPPVVVPIVLNPENGEPMPKEGSQTGRLALMDLMAETYWGGILTGDEVTLNGWSNTCRCGKSGLYLNSTIRRYSDDRNMDDKVNCAGAGEAHDQAIDFLISNSGDEVNA